SVTAVQSVLPAARLTIPLLETKLARPRVRPHIVARARLVERLNAGLHHALMLVAAPAGFGKTTALAEWIAQQPPSVGLICLDAGDNDPTRFWTYVIAALQRLHPKIGTTALALLQAPQPPGEAFLTLLLNEIAVALPAAQLETDQAGTAGYV